MNAGWGHATRPGAPARCTRYRSRPDAHPDQHERASAQRSAAGTRRVPGSPGKRIASGGACRAGEPSTFLQDSRLHSAPAPEPWPRCTAHRAPLEQLLRVPGAGDCRRGRPVGSRSGESRGAARGPDGDLGGRTSAGGRSPAHGHPCRTSGSRCCRLAVFLLRASGSASNWIRARPRFDAIAV